MPKPATRRSAASQPADRLIAGAVVRDEATARGKLLDKAFAFAFKGLVYAQIWEDPVVDMEALAIRPDSRIVTIASGSCNALSYLTADPESIVAVDLNTAHIALGRLKIAAIRHLPDHASLHRFLAEADHASNLGTYRQLIAPHLDETSQRYWEGRDLAGRRRIGGFSRGIYKRGLLGNFIGVAHLLAKLYRIDLREILEAGSLDEQRRVFDAKLAPIFDRRFVRWLTDQRASLFGLGIPPAQYDALAGDDRMANVLRRRLEKLACHFPVNDNYFAWQAFSRGYGRGPEHPLPPYLQEANFAALRDRIDRLDVRHANFADHLAGQPDASLDRYVLLDAQDWMDDGQLGRLWGEITRTARPGSRVLFRTAAEPTLLPGRVPDAVLSRWLYEEAESRRLTAADRSSIYGGVHLYVLK
jgi:S-adenosylmethionine-diacylglycerol 3-amino-3-carboxypropyl transferase